MVEDTRANGRPFQNMPDQNQNNTQHYERKRAKRTPEDEPMDCGMIQGTTYFAIIEAFYNEKLRDPMIRLLKTTDTINGKDI